MALPVPALIPASDYLTRERLSETRSEWLDGYVVAMAGGTIGHALIAANIVGELRSRLRHGPCSVYGSDLRVRAGSGLYTYPDAAVTCEPPRFDDAQRDTLLNPIAIFEVLSPATEAFDRGEKFHRYRRIDSLRIYALVSQDRARIECFQRDGDSWVLKVYDGLDAIVGLAAIGCELPLAEVYASVALPTDAE